MDDEYNYAILLWVKMGSNCLGLHDKTLRCEVITFQNYCYALVFPHGIFVDFYHAVGTEVSAFWDIWGGIHFVCRGNSCPFLG